MLLTLFDIRTHDGSVCGNGSHSCVHNFAIHPFSSLKRAAVSTQRHTRARTSMATTHTAAAASAAAYPAEPFAQADSLMAGLIDSYHSSSDAADMADIRRMVETTVKIAQDREFRVAASIKGVVAS